MKTLGISSISSLPVHVGNCLLLAMTTLSKTQWDQAFLKGIFMPREPTQTFVDSGFATPLQTPMTVLPASVLERIAG